MRSGELNRREAARLERALADIRRMERRAAADGRITPRERARIEYAQDQLSRHIAHETHDRQTRR